MHGTNLEDIRQYSGDKGRLYPLVGASKGDSIESELINHDGFHKRNYKYNSTNYKDHSANRLWDVVASIAFIIILLPVFALISLGVYVADPGPILFRHNRVGMNGMTFKCLKFRTMHIDAEERLAEILASDPRLHVEWLRNHKLANDPRVTGIGRFLRATSLDELPQLFNVLFGDMSLVGPRPIVDAEIPRYGRFISHYFRVKPGLTGLWQVTGRSDTTYRRRVATDVLYVRTKSFWRDALILLATAPALLTRRGAR